MQEYTIRYVLKSIYDQPVKNAFYQLLVLPHVSSTQQVFDVQVKCSLDASQFISHNMFGFKVLQYSSHRPIQRFDFKLQARVVLEELNPFDFICEHPQKEQEQLNDPNFYIDNALFLRTTELTHVNGSQARDWIQFDRRKNLLEFLLQLNQTVYENMQYKTGETTTQTTAVEAMARGKGVCQDYTHIFLAIARQNGIPARYTSGYLNQGAELCGDLQTHAWVEAFIPYVGWLGLDPTNNLLVDQHYIKIAHGTDYSDCSPITGILETKGEQLNSHMVSVITQ